MTNKDYNKLFPDNRDIEAGTLRQAQMVMLRILKVIDDICREHNIEYWLDGGTLLGAVRHQGFIPWDDDIDIGMMRTDYNRFIEISAKLLPSDMFLQTRLNDNYYNITAQAKVRDTKSLFVEEFEDRNELYHQGIYVDIFAYDNLPKSTLKRKFYKNLTKKLCKLERAKLLPAKKFTSDAQYKIIHHLFPLSTLQMWINKLIKHTNYKNSETIGFGLDSNLKRTYEKSRFFPLAEIEFEKTKFFAPREYDYYLSKTYGNYMKLPPADKQAPSHSTTLIPNFKNIND